MKPKKPVIAYYRAVKTKAGEASPTVEQQRAELTRRLAMSPHRELVAEFTEEEIAKDGDLKRRRQLEKVLAEAARLEDCIIAMPRMAKKAYRYKALPELLDGQKVIYLREPLPAEQSYKPAALLGNALSIDAGQVRSIEADFDQLWDEVERNCSEILQVLKEVGTRYLYRGVRSTTFKRAGVAEGTPSVFISHPMDDKPALETSPGIHQVAVEWMKLNGFEAHRGNSVYVSTNPGVARGYTSSSDDDAFVYAIFPCNGFHFTWSRQFYDLGKNFGDATDPLDLLLAADLVSNDLKGSILDEHELLFSGVPYYAINFKKYGKVLNGKLGIKPSSKPIKKLNRWTDLVEM